MEQAIADAGLERGRGLQRAHRPDRRLRRALDPRHRRGRRHHPREGPQAHRPVRGAQGDELGPVGDAVDLVQDQGDQLFDLLGLRDLDPLHRRGRRADPARQAGHRLRRRLRGAGLDPVGAVRRHGRHVQPASTTGPREARRAYDEDRDGFVIAGGAGMVVLEELEHAKARGAKIYAEIVGYAANSDGYDMVAPSGEGAARCMRLALAGGGRPQDRLPQSARHLDRRSATLKRDGRGARGVRRRRAADLLDQVADRPQPGRGRRAGGDLLPLDDAGRLRLPRAPTSRPSTRPSPTCRSCASARTVQLDTVMSNGFGFGGTNGCLVMSRYDG